MIMASLAFFVMMSEIPKQVPYQKYSTLRMTRRRWLASLILFCMMIVLLYLALMIVSSVLFSLPYVTPGGGWSDLERLAADPDLIYEPPYIPAYVTSSLSPLAAGVIAGAVLFLFWRGVHHRQHRDSRREHPRPDSAGSVFHDGQNRCAV